MKVLSKIIFKFLTLFVVFVISACTMFSALINDKKEK